jgi:hypothetical protein
MVINFWVSYNVGNILNCDYLLLTEGQGQWSWEENKIMSDHAEGQKEMSGHVNNNEEDTIVMR